MYTTIMCTLIMTTARLYSGGRNTKAEASPRICLTPDIGQVRGEGWVEGGRDGREGYESRSFATYLSDAGYKTGERGGWMEGWREGGIREQELRYLSV